MTSINAIPFVEGTTGTLIQVRFLDQAGAALDVSAATALTIRVRNGSGPTEDITDVYFDSVEGNGTGTDGWVYGVLATALRPTMLTGQAFGTHPNGFRIVQEFEQTVVARL